MRDGQFTQSTQTVDTIKKATEKCHNGIDEKEDVIYPVIPNYFLKDSLSNIPNAETNFLRN